MPRSFSIEINIAESFTVDEIWPDGDAPDNPTLEDVKAAFFKEPFTNAHRRCESWGLKIRKEDLRFTVHDPEEVRKLKELAVRLRAKRASEPADG